MLKAEFPNRPVELMIVANLIPYERRLAAEQLDIDCVEIAEKKFRDIAKAVGFEFVSEQVNLNSGVTDLIQSLAKNIQSELLKQVQQISIHNTLLASPMAQYSGIYLSQTAWVSSFEIAIESQESAGGNMIFGIRKGGHPLSGENIHSLVTRLGKGKRSQAWYWFRNFERPWTGFI
jgi:hypothetical protein